MEVTDEKKDVSESQSQSRLRLLVVEDDYPSREVMKEYLSEHGECSAAENGVKGVEAFKEALDQGRPFDLVCLDIMMPEMNGHDALKAIRQLEQERGIPASNSVKVIMTTAKDQARDMLESFNEGCEAYIVKPVRQEKLIEEMQNLELV